MPLVDYGSSDESESEESPSTCDEKEDRNVGKAVLVKENQVDSIIQNAPLSKETSNDSKSIEAKLFALLPEPKSTFSLGEDALRLLSKNKNQPVKIVLPSLSDLQTGDNEENRKKKPSTKGSGLFALLPAPKNVNSLIPKSITNKLNHFNKTKPVSKVKQLPLSKSNSEKKYDDEDDEHEGNPSSFFFNSSDDIKLPEAVIDEPFTDVEKINPNSSLIAHLSTPGEMPLASSGVSSEGRYPPFSESGSDNRMIEAMNTDDYSNLDDEAIEKLCGTRARKRKGEISEEVININVDSMVGDAYMRLSKDLTKGHEHSGYKKAKNLSVVERRKHQITYLASQAKEKEMELRNQWANSRMTRKQTQSKYGF